VKRLLRTKGLWLAAGSILLLMFLFVRTYLKTIVGIPSPEFEPVRRFYWWFIVFGCGFLAALAFLLWIKDIFKQWLFPLVVMGLGTFYLFALTPFSAPDEAAHFVSAYRLSSQMMGKQAVAGEEFLKHATPEEKERVKKGANVLVRSGDDVLGLYAEPGQRMYNLILTELFSIDHSQSETVREEVPVNTTPVVYLPQAAGITLARLLHLGYIPLVYLGRFMNLLAFAAMAAVSVRLMPFKKEVLMAVSCLPMTLHLASSYSYDTAFIGLSMLLLSWCFHLAYEKEEIKPKDLLVLTLLLILLEPGKIVYLPAAGICLLIPKSKFKTQKHYWISVFSVLAVMLLAVFLVNRLILSAWAGATESYVGWSEAAGYNLSDVWQRPFSVFTVFYETLVTQYDYYLVTMLGGFLGNLDPNLTVPPVCLTLLWYALFISAVKREGEVVKITDGQKLWILFLVFTSAVLVLTSMFLGWTPRTLTYITGVQGRYFIPLLPLMLLTIYDRRLVIGVDLRKSAWYLECFVSIYALIRICSTSCLRY